MESGNIKVYSEFYVNEDAEVSDDDMTSKEDLFLLKYVDNCPTDTMTIIGPFNSILTESNLVKITSGVDTAYINIAETLKRSLDIRFMGITPKCNRYRFSKHFTLSNSSFPTDFQINIAIQDNPPLI